MSSILNADELVDALSAALDATEPPLEVYEGLLRLIAKFVPFGK